MNPADTPILVLALTSGSLPLTTVDAYAEDILLQETSQISGVGLVGIAGQEKPAVRVQLLEPCPRISRIALTSGHTDMLPSSSSSQ